MALVPLGVVTPEGGAGGGRIVAEGTPEDVARTAASFTGRYLKPVLAAQAKRGTAALKPPPSKPRQAKA